MKPLLILGIALVGSTAAFAGKPCEELKTEIAAKLDAKGVKAYTLEIVDKDKAGDATVIGSCQGGTKQIAYKREGAASKSAEPADAKEPSKPASTAAAKDVAKPTATTPAKNK